MRWLWTTLWAMTLSIGWAACGAPTKDTSLRRTPSVVRSNRDAEGDSDNPSGSRYDSDDNDVLYFGRAATPSEERAISTVVRRYYAAASVADGARACRLLYSLTAEDFAEEHGQPPDPSGLPRPGACARAVSVLFRQQHRRFAADAATLRVARVRVSGTHAIVLLDVGEGPLHHTYVQREQGGWKVKEFWETGMH
jgi:hypothetical protein